MAYKKRNFTGYGKVWANGIDVGNVDGFSLGFSTSEDTVKNYMVVNGGDIDSYDNLDGIDLTVSCLDLTPSNFKMALRANISEIAQSAMNITKSMTAEGLIEFEGIGTVTSITVDGQPAVEGVDYAIFPAGVYAYKTGAYVISGSNVAQMSIQALVNAAQELRIVVSLQNKWDGTNDVYKFFKVKLSVTEALALIGGEQTKLELKGKLLADTSKPSGLSQYFEVLTNFK